MCSLLQIEPERGSCILYILTKHNHLQGKQLAERGRIIGLLAPSEIRELQDNEFRNCCYKYRANTLKVMHKISYSKKQFVIQTGLYQSMQKRLSQSKLLFALVFKRQTLKARSLHSATLSVSFSIAVNKSDYSHIRFPEILLLKHLDL